MGGLKDMKKELWLKPLAERLIKDSRDAHDLLIKIGWDLPTGTVYRLKDGTPNARGERLINERIQIIFGTAYEDAKIRYSSGYLGNI